MGAVKDSKDSTLIRKIQYWFVRRYRVVALSDLIIEFYINVLAFATNRSLTSTFKYIFFLRGYNSITCPYRTARETRYLHTAAAQSFASFREAISPFISGTPFVFRNISARCKTWCSAIIHMLNVPRCCRGYTRCAENKRFRLSNFPSLSQLSLSSDVGSRARAHEYVCSFVCK